ncbi:MAG: hypothetical protein JSW60_06070 [Thermoplasmatales archaeon]|nr:MAG: hypothetical protein JSW60_06070 [Thermoplasmatales archaeon]
MDERKQNIIGGIILAVIIIIIVSYWLIISGNNIETGDNEIILTPLEVTADPAAYMGNEIKVEGVVITNEQEKSSFLMMPIDIYIQCDRNAFCGEEYTHLRVDCKTYLSEKTIPFIEHNVIVNGNIKKNSDGTYVLVAKKINDKGKI